MRHSRAIAAALALLLVAIPARAGEKYALLVGVRQYETPDLRPLNFAEADVEELAKLLIRSGYQPENVKLLTQKAGAESIRYLPTAAHVRKELDLILKHLDEGDSVIVALTGHGVQFRDDEEAYFCPADAQLADKSTLISVAAIYDKLRASEAGVKLLLVDACRNNPMTDIGKDAGRPVVDLESVSRPLRKKPPGGVAALFSCSTGEKSYEHPELRHGVFFHFVLKALEGEADPDADGKVDLSELTAFTSRRVYRFVENKLGVEQSPEFLGKLNAVGLVDVGKAGTPKSFINSIGMKFVTIPAGDFLMGSPEDDKEAKADEKPQHKVRITKPFYLGITEVTRGQFRRFVDESGYQTEAEKDGKGGWGVDQAKAKFSKDPKYTWRNAGFDQADDHPVVNVSWNDAVAFADWLGRKEGKTYRLPTEAEWEYSCRGGTTTRYQTGDDPEGLAAVGNVTDATAKAKFPNWTSIAAADGFVFTAPVGQFRANAFGLHDMHGNVWEWCSDWYKDDYYKGSPSADPSGPFEASVRVLRGGGWFSNPRDCRSADRDWDAPGYRNGLLGFRLALEQFTVECAETHKI